MREVVVWNTFNKRIKEWLHYYVVHSSLSIAWSTSFVWCYSLNCSQRLQLWWKNNWNVLFRCMLLLVCCLMMQIPWLLWWNLRKHHKSHMLILVDWINRYRKSRYFADNPCLEIHFQEILSNVNFRFSSQNLKSVFKLFIWLLVQVVFIIGFNILYYQ